MESDSDSDGSYEPEHLPPQPTPRQLRPPIPKQVTFVTPVIVGSRYLNDFYPPSKMNYVKGDLLH